MSLGSLAFGLLQLGQAADPAPPLIHESPPTQLVAAVNADVSLSVTAAGSDLSYQWFRDAAALPGQTASGLRLLSVDTLDSGLYRVVVSNPFGNATASTTLDVLEPPAILHAPEGLTVGRGEDVIVDLEMSGTGPFVFFWHRGGELLADQSTARLELRGVTPADAGYYTCIASNAVGTADGSFSVLVQGAPPFFTHRFQEVVLSLGGEYSFFAPAVGWEPMTYQWYLDGNALDGANGPGLTIERLTDSQAGTYRVRATNPFGTTEAAVARLEIVRSSLSFRSYWIGCELGDTCEWRVEITNNVAYSSLWTRNGVYLPGTPRELPPTQGETTNRLHYVIDKARMQDGGKYGVTLVSQVGANRMIGAQALRVGDPTVSSVAARFADRVLLESDPQGGWIRGMNRNASAETGEPDHAGNPARRSVWYRWIAPVTGIATFSTEGSQFDTVLAVYRGTILEHLETIVSDDDSGGYLTSRVKFGVAAGEEYAMAVDDKRQPDSWDEFHSWDEFLLTWELEPTADPFPLIAEQPASVLAALGDEVVFWVSLKNPSPEARYQWYFRGEPIPAATSPEVRLPAVRPGHAGAYHVEVSFGQRSVTSAPAILEAYRAEGEVPWLALGQDKLEDLPPFPRDLSRQQGLVSGFSYVVYSTTDWATQSPGEVDSKWTRFSGPAKWYQLKVPGNGYCTVTCSGGDLDKLIAVYQVSQTGLGLGDRVGYAEERSTADRPARLRFRVTEDIGRFFYILVASATQPDRGYAGDTLTLRCVFAEEQSRLTSPTRTDKGPLQFRLQGVRNSSYRIEVTADPVGTWAPVATQQMTATDVLFRLFSDPEDPQAAKIQFYRAQRLTADPLRAPRPR